MTTSVQVQYRRGTASQVASFTGAQGELVVDTTNNRVVIQDGSTAGGWPAARLVDVPIASRTPVSDISYTALTTDRCVAYTALTVSRTVSLPAAASFPVGIRLTILDETGLASGTKTITVAASGTDAIDGAANAVITSSYGYLALESNGSNKWTIVDQATSSLAAVGIGGAADPNNPLSVTANNALLNALTTGAGGTGDLRVQLNKASATNTASTLYQDGSTGHAEVGLTGDDNFHFKVSPDGSTWYDALDITNSSGYVTANYGLSTVAPGAGDASTRAITSAWHGQNLAGGFLNKFRNGTMDVWQRGSSITVTTSSAYTADGWIVLPTGGSVTAAQAGGRLLTKNSLQVTGASSVTDVTVKQRIESMVAAAFCSQTVTVQAQVYNGTGASITPTLTVKHAGSQDSWGSPVTDLNAVSLQPCANGSWTQIGYAFAANASSYNGLEIGFDFGNNFSTTGKSIQVAECDFRATPGVATGINANLPPPELRPIATEMAFCQRYYQVIPSYWGVKASSAYSPVQIGWFTSFRATPTITYQDAAGTTARYSSLAPSNALTNGRIVNNAIVSSGYVQFILSNGDTDIGWYITNLTASAEL